MKVRVSRKTLIRLGALLGVGAAEGSVLAACEAGSASRGVDDGTGDDGSGGSGATGEHSKTSDNLRSRPEKAASDRQAIVPVSEMRPGTAMKFEDARGNPAVLVRLRSGKFVAYSAVCPHQGCIVAYRDEQLACPCHGSIFDPANNARVVIGPAPRPLLKILVEVKGREVVRS